MKKSIGFTAATTAILTLMATRCIAVPMNGNNDAMNYMFKAPNLSRVSAGVYFSQQDRGISVKNSSFETELTEARVVGYVGFDLFKWLNVYAIGGTSSVKLDETPDSDSGMVFGGGLSINLLNHFIREPVPMEDAFRINFGVQSLVNEVEITSKTFRWVETSAALTFAIVNHTEGDKSFRPESIALYAGPALSLLHSSDFDAKTEGGVVGGIEIYFTDSCSLDVRTEYYDKAGITAGINLRF